MLKGEKVQLRPVRRSDIGYFLKWFNDPEVIQYLSMYLPMTEMYEENYIQELAKKDDTKVRLVIEAFEGQSNKPIGTIGLDSISPKDHHATFGIAIGDKDYWSKGYGTEAARLIVNYGFQQLNLHRINSTVIGFNERSARMHKKVGFKEEGRQREFYFKNGAFHDQIVFGILQNDWKGL
jgi:diamine N-acetyltransferase